MEKILEMVLMTLNKVAFLRNDTYCKKKKKKKKKKKVNKKKNLKNNKENPLHLLILQRLIT
jgi:hypothetical protein